MKRNKIFSFPLMLEGIKQTKVVGICFAIISLLISCGYPILRLISYSSMDYDTLKVQPSFTINLASFSLPIFVIQYIMPVTMIFVLFSFMNKRKASDFYHSIPMSRTCIYLTYTAVALIWSLVIILANTFISYIIYACTPKLIISAEFILPTIIASFVLSMLTVSIALVAKGLSGTMFTNIIITIIVAFLPRVIILLYTIAVNSAVKIADVSFMSFADIRNNILFAYVTTNNEVAELFTAETLWYSVVLAVIYFAVGFVLHKFRNSETAGKNSSYKGVQIVVRTLLGAVPLLMISMFFAIGSKPVNEVWFIGIVISLLVYFLYELITTKNAKKLLTAIPFYAIPVILNVVFVFICLGARDSILNDIPQVSDISSVSVSSYDDFNYYGDNYYQYKVQDVKIKDKELINILQSALTDNVQKVKDGKSLTGNSTELYTVIYHCNSGKDIKRKVYVDINKYGNNGDSAVLSILEKDDAYIKAMSDLPTDKEIKHIESESCYGGSIGEVDNDTWELYKSEYNALSDENKSILNYHSDCEFRVDSFLNVSGYVGANGFSQTYLVLPNLTPKTYDKLINSHMKECFKDGTINKISESIKNDDSFIIEFENVQNNDSINLHYDKNTDLIASIYASLQEDIYDIDRENNRGISKYLPELRRIGEIIVDSITENVDVSSKNLIRCEITYDMVTNSYKSEDGSSYGYDIYECEEEVIYINMTDEQYNEIISIVKKVCKNT